MIATIKIVTDKVFCPSCLLEAQLKENTGREIIIECAEHGETYLTIPEGMRVA